MSFKTDKNKKEITEISWLEKSGHKLDSVQKSIIRIEREAQVLEKNWYFKVIDEENLSDQEIEKHGKFYGLVKHVITIFQKFAKSPNSFADDYEWFYPLQKFYITLAEWELKNRERNLPLEKLDPFMRIYLKLRKREIEDYYEFRKRYRKYYREANFVDKDLLKYAPANDLPFIRRYIGPEALTFENPDEWFDAFQRLYINVVKSLTKLRESIGKNKKGESKSTDIFSGLKIDQPTKEILKLRIEAEIKARIEQQKNKFIKAAPAAMEKPGLELPEVAPKLYSERHLDRADKDLNAKEFLNKYYGEYLKAGVLYQYHLRELDPSLLKGVKNYCENRSMKFSSVIPPKKVEIDRKLAALEYDSKELNRMATNIRNREKIKP